MELIPDKVWINDGGYLCTSGKLPDLRRFFAGMVKLGAIDALGQVIDPHAFDAWLYRTNPPTPGQDSALQLGMEDCHG